MDGLSVAAERERGLRGCCNGVSGLKIIDGVRLFYKSVAGNKRSEAPESLSSQGEEKGPSVRNKFGGSGLFSSFFLLRMNPKSLSSTLSLSGTGLAMVATVAVDQGLRANYRKHHLIQGRRSGG